LYDLILYLQATNQHKKETISNLLAENPNNEGFYQKLNEVFDDSLRRSVEEAIQNRPLDQKLNTMISNLRAHSQWLEEVSQEYNGQKDVASSPWNIMSYFYNYVRAKYAYESTLHEIVSYLFKDQWQEQLDARFQSFFPEAWAKASSSFLGKTVPYFTAFNNRPNFEQEVDLLYDKVAKAKEKKDMDIIFIDFIINVFGREGTASAVGWSNELQEALLDANSNKDEQSSVASLLQYLEKAYSEEGILSRPGVQTLFSWLQTEWIPRRLKIAGINFLIKRSIDSYPLTFARKERIKKALTMMTDELLEPSCHGTVSLNHPFRSRMKNFITQSCRFLLYYLA
ncbi:MAG: hypothetical protein WAM28_07390, partial [Chlamydiales bacterium]